MKKFKKDALITKDKKLVLNRETIKNLTLHTQVTGGRKGATYTDCISAACKTR